MTVTESVEFLRRSLLDLDDEFEAGDLSEDDFARLRDEYTVRLARALRNGASPSISSNETAQSTSAPPSTKAPRSTKAPSSEASTPDGVANSADPAAAPAPAAEPDADIPKAEVPGAQASGAQEPGAQASGAQESGAQESGGDDRPGDGVDANAHPAGPAKPPARRPAGFRLVAVVVGVAAFAIAAGLLVARTSGTRTAGQSLTGDIRQTIRQRLDQCLQLSGQGQLLESVKCYDGVLKDQPSSAEALTYRAWTLVRAGDQRLWPVAQQNLDQAVSLDPSYPDARVFRAVLYREEGKLAEARTDLAAFDSVNPPQMMRDLVDQMGLRASLDPSSSSTTAAPAGGQSATTTTGK